jgi:hypothetical protein
MNRPRIKIAYVRRGSRNQAPAPPPGPPALVLTANSSTMSLDWIYSGPACDGFHIFVHQPNDPPGTFIDRAQVGGDLRTWLTDFDDPADAAGYAYYIVPMDGDGHPLTPQSVTVSFVVTPPSPEVLQAQVDALKARVDAQQVTIDGFQTQINDVRALANRCAFAPSLTILDTEFHDPPTEADLEVVRNYINDMAGQLQGGW